MNKASVQQTNGTVNNKSIHSSFNLMTKKTILGISLALVMLCGSTPLGFSEPLRVQLEQGIETSQIQCDNTSHVLVQRTNGKLACVSEKSAERMNWEIIETNISLVEYDYPLSSKTFENEFNSEPIGWGENFDVTISNIPEIGETAVVTVTITNDMSFDLKYNLPNEYISIDITDNFEFVDVPQDKIITGHDGRYLHYNEKLDIDAGQTATISATVKAVKAGMGHVGGDAGDHGFSYWMYVDTEQTLLRDDYEKLHPPVQSQNTVPICENSQPCPEPEPEPPAPNEEGENPTDPSVETPITEEELREDLKHEDLTEEEIEAIVRKTIDPDSSTQSFFLPSAYAQSSSFNISGRLVTTTSQLTLTSDSSTIDERIHDANVCAWDWDYTDRRWTNLGCDKTSSTGYYSIKNVSLPSANRDGALDIRLTFSTNGDYSVVKDARNIGSITLGDIYQVVDPLKRDVSSWSFKTKYLDTSDLTTANENRAFWITDGIGDTHQFFEDEFSKNLRQVKVGWQFDHTTEDGFGTGMGARYISSTETIFLDGYQTGENRDDDSNERWTIIHEYGHHTMKVIFGSYPNTSPSGEPRCSGHGIANTRNVVCAWSEGWADILPSLVDKKASYPRNDERNFLFEEDKYQYRSNNNKSDFPTVSGSTHIGQKSEGQVAAAIWDLYDSNVDRTHDYLNGVKLDDRREGYNEIATIFKEKPQNFEEFYDKWQNRYTTKDATNVMKLHYMSFVANTPPVATPQSTITVNEDASTTFYLRGTDADNDDLTFIITNYPDDGTLSKEIGSFGNSQKFKYTPDLSFSGTDEFWFKVNDGTKDSSPIKVSIRVTALTPITFTTTWDGISKIILVFSERLTTQFSTSDFRLSSGTITSVTNFADSTTRHLAVSSVPVNTQITVEYVGNGVLNLGGSEKLQNGASDVTPTSPNPQPPRITTISNVNVNEGSYREVDVTARDGSTNNITLTLDSAPTWVAIDDNHNGNGEIEITVPSEATSTRYSVTVRATNNNGYDTETFNIIIGEINQSPILSDIGNKSVKEESTLSFRLSSSDSDRPSQTLRYSMSNAPTGSSINSSTGLFSWTPNHSQVGTHSIIFTVTDDGFPISSDSQNVEFTVTAIPVTASQQTNYYVNQPYTFTCDNTETFGYQLIVVNTIHGYVPVNPTSDPSIKNTITFTPTELGKYQHECYDLIWGPDNSPIVDIFSFNVIEGSEYSPIDSTDTIPDTTSTSVTVTTPTSSTVNTESFTISGTSTNVNEVALYKGGIYTNSVTYPDSSGDWSFTVTLSEGENIFVVMVTNGNYGSDGFVMINSDEIIVTLDTISRT